MRVLRLAQVVADDEVVADQEVPSLHASPDVTGSCSDPLHNAGVGRHGDHDNVTHTVFLSRRTCEQPLTMDQCRLHRAAPDADECCPQRATSAVGVLMLSAGAVVGPAHMSVMAVFMVFTLGVLVEAHVSNHEVTCAFDFIHVESLLAAGHFKSAVQLRAAIGGCQRNDLVVVTGLHRLIRCSNNGFDLGAGGLDANKPDTFTHAVQAHQSLQEQPVGEIGGLRGELADSQRFGEDLGQFVIAVCLDPLARVVDIASLQGASTIGHRCAIGGVAVRACGRQNDVEERAVERDESPGSGPFMGDAAQGSLALGLRLFAGAPRSVLSLGRF